MSRITVAVVGSSRLSRVVAHLLRGRPEFEVVAFQGDQGNLTRRRGHPLPELIIAEVKPVSIGIRRVIAAIKQASPSSKVILSCPLEELGRTARGYGADACLRDEKLTSHLLRLARAVAQDPSAANEGD